MRSRKLISFTVVGLTVVAIAVGMVAYAASMAVTSQHLDATATSVSLSTTTTTVACSVPAAPANQFVDLGDSSGHLANALSESVTTAGPCTSVSLQFVPGGTGFTSTQTLALTGGPTWTGTIGANAYKWSTGSHTVTIFNSSTSLSVTFTIKVCSAGTNPCT